jgi:CheY-like chemotaxis protein
MIAVIRSGTALARESLPQGHPAHADLADVASAADRGAALTRQLLSFARTEVAGVRRTDVSLVLAEMARFVPRLMGRGIQVRFVEGPALGEVPLSATGLEQVILNLVLNARDAMPSGGWITVEARRVDIRNEEGASLSPGPHVEISVRDQGTGMTAEVRRRLFEPFFTTKESGMGSGLGLATSREIVEGGAGAIEVETEEGRGTVIRVLLPRIALAAVQRRLAAPESGAGRRSRVLLVDHDPALVALLSRMLAARGHEVIAAASPLEARQQAASFPGAVDVILTGLDLGNDHGVTVLGEVRRTSPRARAILLSGEVRDGGDVDHLLEAGVELVRRPVPPEALVEAVERAAARAPVLREPAVA